MSQIFHRSLSTDICLLCTCSFRKSYLGEKYGTNMLHTFLKFFPFFGDKVQYSLSWPGICKVVEDDLDLLFLITSVHRCMRHLQAWTILSSFGSAEDQIHGFLYTHHVVLYWLSNSLSSWNSFFFFWREVRYFRLISIL